MPSDSNGVYTLPSGYLAVTGQTIQASQHNPPLEDLGASMTLRMMTTGSTPMSGPLKAADGTSTAPSLTLASATSSGFYKHASGGMGMRNVVGGVPCGTVLDYAGSTAPAGWLLCYGQSLSRADYPDLFAAIGTTFGAVDGSHFTLPDGRGAVVAGLVTMGGTDRGILTGGASFGALIGAQTITLGIGEIPAHSHSGTTDSDGVQHDHPLTNGASQIQDGAGTKYGGGGVGNAVTITVGNASAYLHDHDFTTGNTGGGGSHVNVQPTLILNKIIFTGV